MNELDLPALRESLGRMGAEEVLAWAAENLRGEVVAASSLGAEGQVIYDMINRLGLDIPAFTLDTGRLFKETYDLIAANEQRYGKRIKLFFPDAKEVEDMVAEHGVNLFYESVELRRKCCRIRKLDPLAKALKPYGAWICGLRRGQSPTRAEVSVIERDGEGRIKFNPLAGWSEQEVMDYLLRYDVPRCELWRRGFPSVGCACCTRAVAPGEDGRAGRWWWEDGEHKECGLHWVDGKPVRK